MKTRENKAMRFASVLLVLTLLATSLTAGTFAKYVTGDNGSAEARVAKFGVDVSVDATNVFGTTYKDTIVEADAQEITVKASADTNVVAPGTNGSMSFTIEGEPETSVNLDIAFDMDTLKEVMLAEGTYVNGETEVDVDSVYNPVKWSLAKNQTPVQSQQNTTLAKINDYFKTLSTTYTTETFKSVVGEYTLSWAWDYDTESKDGVNDSKDTLLGDLAAGDSITKKGDSTTLTDGIDYILKEKFKLTISVEQAD